MPISPSRPPTRVSISSPSIVCVSITARSSAVSGPGLLMISAGIRILPTSCSSAANSASRRSRGDEPEPVADRERQLDDVAAVLAGVGVVGLDHVAEQERGAAVGAGRARARGRSARRARARRASAARRAAATSRTSSGCRAEVKARAARPARGRRRRGRPSSGSGRSCSARSTRPIQLRSAARAEVEGELGGERGQVDRPVAPVRRRSRGEASPRTSTGPTTCHELHQHQEQPVERARRCARCERRAEQERGGDAQRHVCEREHEEHRHEHELRRQRRAGADLELDARGAGVEDDENTYTQAAGARPLVEAQRERRPPRRRSCRRSRARPSGRGRRGAAACEPRLEDQAVRLRVERLVPRSDPTPHHRHGLVSAARGPPLNRSLVPGILAAARHASPGRVIRAASPGTRVRPEICGRGGLLWQGSLAF